MENQRESKVETRDSRLETVHLLQSVNQNIVHNKLFEFEKIRDSHGVFVQISNGFQQQSKKRFPDSFRPFDFFVYVFYVKICVAFSSLFGPTVFR